MSPRLLATLRGHVDAISGLAFTVCDNGRFLVSGDASGQLIVWSRRLLRKVCSIQQAHSNSIVSVAAPVLQAYSAHTGQSPHHDLPFFRDQVIVTYGRDNLIRIWRLRCEDAAAQLDPDNVPGLEDELATLTEVLRMPGDAITFCRLSMLDITPPVSSNEPVKEANATLVIAHHVNATNSRIALTMVRLKFVLNEETGQLELSDRADGMKTHICSTWQIPKHVTDTAGLCMALSLYRRQPSDDAADDGLRLLTAHDDGSVVLWRWNTDLSATLLDDSSGDNDPFTDPIEYIDRTIDLDSCVPHVVWRHRVHEQTIFSIAVSPDARFAYTAAADSYLRQFTLDEDDSLAAVGGTSPPFERSDGRHSSLDSEARGRLSNPTPLHPYRRQQYLVPPSTDDAGVGVINSANDICVRYDGKVVVVAGWDGDIGVFAGKSLSLLGNLAEHRHRVTSVTLSCQQTNRIHSTTQTHLESGVESFVAAGAADLSVTLWVL
ncbi:WD40 repeat-like protein [Ramicandelaber brevisporus]|nr:WD40 repeat-like protein [Ramicandelaber brevisporus]